MSGKFFPVKIAALFFMASVLSLSACSKEDEGEKIDPAEKAKQEIVASMLVPPDAELRDVTVLGDQDMLIATFGSQESIDFLNKFVREAINRNNYRISKEIDTGLYYYDSQGRQVGVMFFPRDPEIHKIKTSIKVAVNPLPPELKKAPAAESK